MYKYNGLDSWYSGGFKLKILAELSTGNYSKKKLGEIYGINHTTINGMAFTACNQVCMFNITCNCTVKGLYYLARVTDMFFRKIVGYDISDSMELAGCLRALKRALRTIRPAAGLVHLSDRGIQHCSNQYVEQLTRNQIIISIKEENHCYKNAIAERVDGILKDEFCLDQCFFSTRIASIAAKDAIEIYNSKQLHISLGYKTPNMVFESAA